MAFFERPFHALCKFVLHLGSTAMFGYILHSRKVSETFFWKRILSQGDVAYFSFPLHPAAGNLQVSPCWRQRRVFNCHIVSHFRHDASLCGLLLFNRTHRTELSQVFVRILWVVELQLDHRSNVRWEHWWHDYSQQGRFKWRPHNGRQRFRSRFVFIEGHSTKHCVKEKWTNSKIKICFYDTPNHTREIKALFKGVGRRAGNGEQKKSRK